MKTNLVNQVAAFEQLLSYCNAHGAVFNPSKSSIKITALNTLLTQAQQSLQAVKVARTTYDNAVIARQQSFNELPKIATRIINALDATDASKEVVKKANAFRQSLNPKSSYRSAVSFPDAASTGSSPTQEVTPTRERGMLDYTRKTDNFAALVQVLSVEPLYKPNEANLQIAALSALVTTLRDKTKAVYQAKVALSNARISRDKLMYEANGISDSATAVKKYVKSLFGPLSSPYKQIAGISFKKGRF